jgi:hypothetical protein
MLRCSKGAPRHFFDLANGMYFNWTQAKPLAAYSRLAGLNVQKSPFSTSSPTGALSAGWRIVTKTAIDYYKL